MRIGLVTPGGITAEFRNWPERRLASALARHGQAVRAVTLWDPSVKHLSRRAEEIEGVAVVRVRPRLREVWRALSSLGELDVLHIHHLRNDLALPAVLYARRRRIPVVFTPHGILHDPFIVSDRDHPLRTPIRPQGAVRRLRDLPREGLRRGWKSYRLHRVLYLANRVIALSEHERGVLSKLGVAPGRIAVLPQWIEAEPAPPRELSSRPSILFIGQFKFRKGFDLLLRALPSVCKLHPSLGAYFVTQNPLHLETFDDLVRRGGLEGRCHRVGQVGEAEKWSLLRSVDLYVLPSRYEGFGLPVFEAMAAGCPVVTTRVPALDEMLRDGEDALLAEPESPESLAEKMTRALDDAELRGRLREAGARLVAERYVESAVYPLYEKLYEEVLRAGDRSP